MLGAIKLRGRIQSNRLIELPRLPLDLPEGQVELILLYPSKSIREETRPSPLDWPILDGGRYLGGTLRREEIYGDAGR